jgi:peptide/nickel transport system permease protein
MAPPPQGQPALAAALPQASTGGARLVGGVRDFLGLPLNRISAALVVLLLAVALLAPVISPYPPDAVSPDQLWQGPSLAHWMGTDEHGRDVMSRVFHGARISLFVGIVTIVAAMLVGVGLGALAGYAGGFVDELVMRIVDIFMSVPGVVLALAIVGMLGPSLTNVILALAVYRAAQFARVTRGSVLSVMARDYIASCRAIGTGGGRIVLVHVLPNCSGAIIVLATVLLGNVILTEATLSFLGMGIQPPQASWGVMIAGGNEYLMFAPWISVFPGVFLLVTMMAFNLLGDGLRDYLDPRGRSALGGAQPMT